MRKPITLLALSLTLTGALTACGQKGPLYLPQDTAAPTSAGARQPQSGSSGKQQPNSAQTAEQDSKSNTEQHTEAEAVAK
ncbi:LPS translocon maturation chaperone LptM [Microbulbifer mangrovi]|uniref:LPS translocon maturation chaperone LptM n=1 Tax=Microbulbifer mangrovi TaxID=927787 RepID=UPI00099040A2|nr:lipoprotein [Microbulbifer mangrovi]